MHAFDPDTVPARPRSVLSRMIVAVNLAVFVSMTLDGVSFFSPDSPDLIDWGANLGLLSLTSEPWRLLAAAFVHVGVIHLAFNMWVLWVYGPVAEFIFGRAAFAVVYFGAALASAAVSAAWRPEVVSAGASGAIFGIVGAMIGFFGRGARSNPAVRAHVGSLLAFTGYNVLFGILVPGIDNAAHLGGLFSGLLAGWLLRPRFRRRLPMLLAAAAALLLVALAAGSVGRARINPVLGKLKMASLELREGRMDSALDLARRAVAEDPANAGGHALLGAIELSLENWPEAEKHLAEAARLDPTLPSVHRLWAVALVTQGKYRESVGPLEEALKRAPGDKEILLMRDGVRAHLKSGDNTPPERIP